MQELHKCVQVSVGAVSESAPEVVRDDTSLQAPTLPRAREHNKRVTLYYLISQASLLCHLRSVYRPYWSTFMISCIKMLVSTFGNGRTIKMGRGIWLDQDQQYKSRARSVRRYTKPSTLIELLYHLSRTHFTPFARSDIQQ